MHRFLLLALVGMSCVEEGPKEVPRREGSDGGTFDAGLGVSPRPDAGSSVDAGSDEVDAGVVHDAGVVRDAGSARDAGAFADAGLGRDGGGDAGFVVDSGMDAGAPRDAGTRTDAGAAFDAGAPVDAGVGPAIVFPPPCTTALATLTVRGVSAGATAARINAVAATSTDGFRTFSAQVPLAMGDTTLSLDLEEAGAWRSGVATVRISRVATEQAAVRGSGGWAGRILGAAWDSVGRRVLLSDDVEDGVQAIALETGDRVMLSDSEGQTRIGLGFEIVQPRALDVSGGSAFVVDGASVVRVQLASGDRVVDFTGPSVLSSLALESSTSAWAVVSGPEQVLRIDLATHASTIVSSSSVGMGASLRNVGVGGFDVARRQAYVSHRYQDGITRVDLTTGNRTTFSQAQGAEPRFSDPEHLVVHPQSNRLFVWDSRRLVAVDLTTGRRTLLTGRGFPVDSVYGMAATDVGVVLVDYVPSFEANPRAPVAVMVDPVDGTRVVLSR